MPSKREFVLKAFHNEESDRVPVGFWHHFLTNEDFDGGLYDPSIYEKNIAGHKKFREDFDPDFVKVMTDGFFDLPLDLSEIHTVSDLEKLKPLPEDHPWFDISARLARDVRTIYGDDILIFFNIFSPLSQLTAGLSRERKEPAGNAVLDFLKEDAGAVREALNRIAENIDILIRRVVGEGLADGIYLSVRNPNRSIPADIYSEYVAPGEKHILAEAKKLSPDHILHICGYAGNRNILSVYQDYDVSVFNWAVHAENVSLKEGKAFFGGRAVIGGFDNTTDGVLYRGSRQEIEKAVDEILGESGRKGVILGADCTVPADIDVEHLKWVRERANQKDLKSI